MQSLRPDADLLSSARAFMRRGCTARAGLGGTAFSFVLPTSGVDKRSASTRHDEEAVLQVRIR